MKKLLVWLVCLVMVSGMALAEEGLTQLDSDLGYTLQYDAEAFAPMEQAAEAGLDVLMPTGDAAATGAIFSISPMSGMTEEMAMMVYQSVMDNLVAAGYDVEGLNVAEMENEAIVAGYTSTWETAVQGGYLVVNEAGYFLITLQYPAEAAETVGAQMLEMVKTIK